MSGTERPHFGGKWSDQKLDALASYLTAYTTALKNQPFETVYIDAFAGAGLKAIESHEGDELFDEFSQEETRYRHGSPLIAIETEPCFDKFVFIERDPEAIESLRRQMDTTPAMATGKVKFECGDANMVLQQMAAKSWVRRRAVAFLDPFALSVTWKTIESIAQTEAIDMWLLFPAMAVNRMLTRSGEIPDQWARKLSETFGTDDWRERFYSEDATDLFGEAVVSKTPKVFATLSDYITMRLGTVFAGVNPKPLILRNSTGSPLFLLCFASGSRTGCRIAIRIAKHIIDKSAHGR